HTDCAQRLAARDELAFRHRDRLEVEVRGVEPKSVVEDHESTGEEELGRQRDATAVRGDDGRAHGRREVDSTVRRPGVTVDDTAGAGARTGLVTRYRPDEAVAPE